MIEHPSIRIVVPGKPIAKGRPRLRVFQKNGIIKTSAYTPSKTVDYEKIVKKEALLVKEALGIAPLTGLVKFSAKCYWEYPSSALKKASKKNLVLPEVLLPIKPDCDNILKLLEDSLNGIIYLDDKQVVIAEIEKWRAKQGDSARAEITIWSLENEWKV